MARKVDLYTLLRTYALRHNTANIGLEAFIAFLKNNAERGNGSNLQINDWAGNTKEKVMTELSELINSEKCKLITDLKGQKIFLPIFFVDKLMQVYVTIGEIGEEPYPDEKSLGFQIPDDMVRSISVETGLLEYMNNPQMTDLPVIKLVFNKTFGEALMLSTHIPRRILESAIMKIKEALLKNNELASVRQKLFTKFPNQVPRVKEFLDILMIRPLDAIAQLEDGNEFTFSTWLLLCPHLKSQTTDTAVRNNEISAADKSLFQAASIILVLNNHYKILAMNQKERELMLASIEEKMREPPYKYTMSEIMQFTTKQGIPILNNFPENEFQAFINRKMAVPDQFHLPEWLRYGSGEDAEWFIVKSKVWDFLKLLINEASGKVGDEIKMHWMNVLREYRRDRAMDKDAYFEELVSRNIRLFSPALYAILHDKKTAVLQEELVSEKKIQDASEKYFTIDKLIPVNKLLDLNRQAILNSCRFLLPIWYSIPLIVNIISFFKYGPSGKYVDKDTISSKKKGNKVYINEQARKLMVEMLPEGSSNVDQYIEGIIDRWNQILNKTARDTLVKDVNAIVKSHIHHVMTHQKKNNFNAQMLNDIAEGIILSNTALSKINNREALRLYIKLFITKILANSKI